MGTHTLLPILVCTVLCSSHFGYVILVAGLRFCRGLAVHAPSRACTSRAWGSPYVRFVHKEFDYAAGLLASHGGRFLAGDRFTAADLAFACMAAPVLLVQRSEGYGAALPAMGEVTPEVAVRACAAGGGGVSNGLTGTRRFACAQALAQEMRAHAAGQFALRMFREHRSRPPPRSKL